MQHSNTAGCILLKFYIKPQHTANVYNLLYVVSYRNSTSNHNSYCGCFIHLFVVSYRNSTSNHNDYVAFFVDPSLYLIEILHQTTTVRETKFVYSELYLIEILHQTTTDRTHVERVRRLYLIEILHQTTTRWSGKNCKTMLYLIEILHQTTTFLPVSIFVRRCILSKFYIKPQQSEDCRNIQTVVSYRNSTSNHNSSPDFCKNVKLYLIEILHQTTTRT